MVRHTPEQELTGLRLDREESVPLHQQISERIKRQIFTGAIRAGARLPSSRSLASQLAVSRATVEFAYGILVDEGYVSRRAAAGTCVLSLAIERNVQPRLAPPPLMPGLVLQAGHAPRLFQMGLPALDAFPRKLWARLAAGHTKSLSLSKMIYQEPSGFAPLRGAIANHLAIGRGLVCSESQVFITAGFLGALMLIARTLLVPRDKVWIEDPGFPPARHALEFAGSQLVPVPVDSDGMDVSAGIALAPEARVALVTPAAQFPLGCVLSPERRLQLMSWATESNAWIIEDDYDAELGRPDGLLSAPQRSDAAERTLHIGSFSNVLFPGLRLGYLVVPDSLVAQFERTSTLLPLQQSLLDQAIVCDFITKGYFARHLARMRCLYAERKSKLVEALNEVLDDSMRATNSPGMHVLLRLPPGSDDKALASLARSHGLAVNALSAMALHTETGPGLLLGFANIVPEAAREAAIQLKKSFSSKPR